MAFCEDAIAAAREGMIDALVTAPISKTSWAMAGYPFPGHTELLAKRCHMRRGQVAMMFVTPKLKVALACQTVVENGMHLTQIPFYPGNKALYDIEELSPTLESLVQQYPEVMRCVQCNTCRKVCPQDIEVMQYIAAAMRGDIAKLADLSFDCIMCGLCASRCPGELVQYYIGILGRRLYAKYMMPKAKHLAVRIEELKQGKLEKEIDDLMSVPLEDLKKLYDSRDIEPEDFAGEPAVSSSGEISD